MVNKKGGDAPKKARSAYVFFCQKNRPAVVEEMKGGVESKSVDSIDVVRTLAEGWKKLKLKCKSGDEGALTEMQEYNSQAEQDKVRYYKESATLVGKH